MKPRPVKPRPVKPRLALGLGSDVAGDDAIGLRVVERLAAHPDLPGDVEVGASGTDLLRSREVMRGRERVFLIDAVLGPERTGTVVELDPDDPSLAEPGGSAHQLSPTGSLALLRAVDSAVAELPVTLIGVVIERADMRQGLSEPLADCLDDITHQVLQALAEERA